MFAKSRSSKQMLAFEITFLASCESEFLFVQKNTTKTNMSNDVPRQVLCLYMYVQLLVQVKAIARTCTSKQHPLRCRLERDVKRE